MRFGSVCSGIEAASVAWLPLGWECAFVSEIAKFPCAVLAHHYPDVPNLGDMTKITEGDLARVGPVDVLVGGTPCQSFSVAGLRKGLDDPRGNLALVFLRLLERTRAPWMVWENVPGVLSSNGGRDFGSFLGALAELGYGFAYRVLDAQYAGLAQRRKRVFVVGHLGDWRRAAAVLLERESLSGNPAPRREARQRVAASLTRGADSGGRGGYAGRRREDDANLVPALTGSVRGVARPGELRGQDPLIPTVVGAPTDGAHMGGGSTVRTPTQDELSRCLNAGGMGRQDFETETLIPVGGSFDVADLAPCLRSGNERNNSDPGMEAQMLVAFDPQGAGKQTSLGASEDGTGALGTTKVPAIAFDETQITSRANRSNPQPGDPCHTMAKGARAPSVALSAVTTGMAVRRLTPRECERLQGFPDDYTLIPYRGKPASDGPRYQAIGNSMAVPVVRWIGERIAKVDAL